MNTAQTSALPASPLRHDAYMPWARAVRFRDATPAAAAVGAGQRPWFWLLIELRAGYDVVGFATDARPYRADWIRVPGHYRQPPLGMKKLRYCTALVSRAFLDMLEGVDGAAGPTKLRDAIAACELGYAMAPELLDDREPTAPGPTEAVPGKIVVGVIDDGLAFANERFCSVDNGGRRRTRFVSLWIQDGERDGSAPGLYGRCLPAATLDGHLDHGRRGARRYDEDAIYASADYRVVGHRITHGTHVLDLACGADPSQAADAPLIVGVQVRGDVLEDTSSASGTVFLLDAVWHVLGEADCTLGGTDEKPAPAIINMSMGNIAGPHNGSSIFERALDELIDARRVGDACCHVVMPVGNSYLSRCHAWGELSNAWPMEFDWKIQPGDGTPSFVELWFSLVSKGAITEVDIADVKVVLTSPDEQTTLAVGVNQYAQMPATGEPMALVNLQRVVANGNLGMGLLAVAPTSTIDPSTVLAPPGAWKVAIHYGGTKRINCNAYVQRDDIAFGRRGRGRQSYLDDSGYRRFNEKGALDEADSNDSFVRRVGTQNALATGQRVDVTEGARRVPMKDPLPARYTATGLPTAPNLGGGLRVTAITEDSLVLHGVLASGTRSGSVVSLSGTSMAAPQLARRLAEEAVLGAAAATVLRGFKMHGDDKIPYLAPYPDLHDRSRKRSRV